MSTQNSMKDVYLQHDALGLAALVKRGDVSAAELMEVAIQIVDELNPTLNAVSQRCYDDARERAQAPIGEGVFAGVPFLLKDLATTASGLQSTNSSRYYRLHSTAPASDNEAVRRMRTAGLIPFGFTNVPENGWSLTTEPKLNGPTRNPWNTALTAGGSSGGAGSAVASGMVPLAEGSDGAGSIRMPAAMCGTVGLKPSRGRASIAPAADFWHGGAVFLCLSRTTRDTAAFLDVVSGGTPGEPYALPKPATSYLSVLETPPARLRCGFSVRSPEGSAVDPEIARAVHSVAAELGTLGHHVEPHDMRFDIQGCWQAYTRILAVQAALQFEESTKLLGVAPTPETLEPYTWSAIEMGKRVDAVGHARDIDAMRHGGMAIAASLDAFDVFVSPVMRRLPFPIGSAFDMSVGDWQAYNDAFLKDTAFLFPFNVGGQPSISLPLGISADGLPIGVQLTAKVGNEAVLLQIASLLEKSMPWAAKRPLVFAHN
ncbi:amidase [Pandoraea sputorum]|uniref:6-aminohexanoate-cyclic-dimer hydrolase n=1 Tax=Pandoraea sputorum TaxID=93222 RepID=A0A239SAD1_9BURK|nr:amidase [Pandoraea sputorum]AJC16095.1 amidase [Pandoraea sputorum]SNU82172.1 6-aminohexanoate-cyclic-dimer hydrolase [Pandoraea sputorum]VVE44855.1 amidase [Pandoraea sputorum]